MKLLILLTVLSSSAFAAEVKLNDKIETTETAQVETAAVKPSPDGTEADRVKLDEIVIGQPARRPASIGRGGVNLR